LRFGVTSESDELRRLDELNRAYEAIARNGHSAGAAATRSVTPARKRWYGGRSKPAPWKLDPFETLFVMPDAQPEIAALAQKILALRPPFGMTAEAWNETLADAASKVTDPSWRAKHERAAAEDAWAAARRALEAQAEEQRAVQAEAATVAQRVAEAEAKRQRAADAEAESEARKAAEAQENARRAMEAAALRAADEEVKAQRAAEAKARRDAEEHARRDAEAAARAEAERTAAFEAEARRIAAIEAERAAADARRADEAERAAADARRAAEAERAAADARRAADAEIAAADAERAAAEARRIQEEARARARASNDEDVTDDGQPEIVRKWVEMGVAQIDPASGKQATRRGQDAPRDGSGERVAGGLWGMLEHVLARGERQRESVERDNERVLTLRDGTSNDAAASDSAVRKTDPSNEAVTHNEHRNGHDEPSRPPAFLLIGDAPPAPLDLSGEDTRQFTLGEGPNAAKVQLWRRGDSYMLQQISGAPISIGGQQLTAPIVVLEDGDEIAHDGDVMRIVLSARADGGV
jgi:hypothetical protein